jgi:hypothetical protein
MPWWLLVLTILGVLVDRKMSDVHRLLAIETMLFFQLMYINGDAVQKMGCLVKLLCIFSMMAGICYLWWFWIQWMTMILNL